MAYLIDTYNLLHAAVPAGGALANLTVRSLCQWIVSSPQRIRATLVLDGRPKPDEPAPNEFPDVELVYSGTGVTADKVIGQLVERKANRKNLTVVTNDRAVTLHARRNFASAMSCEAFLEILIGADAATKAALRNKLPQKKTAGTSSPGETAHWLKEFGIETPEAKPDRPTGQPKPASLDDDEIEKLMGGRDE